MMSIAIMQPYIFPYIGYFQMVAAVDTFVFYDDVHFIKKGWINKNRILLHGQDYTFTIPCVKISQNKLINETAVVSDSPEIAKLLGQIESSYRKAPHFEAVWPLVSEVLHTPVAHIGQLAQLSVERVCAYLELTRRFMISSACSPASHGMEKADRLIHITKELGFERYINAPGGMAIYDKAYFAERHVDLQFIHPQSGIEYQQGHSKNFVPWLSIIDVLMYCSKELTIQMLHQYYLD